MRFFMVYSNQYAIGNKPIGIASLSAVLKKAGHEFKLFDCTAFKLTRAKSEDAEGESNLQFKIPVNPERLPSRMPVTITELVDVLAKSIDEFKPDMVGLSALTDDYPLGLGLMRHVKATYPDIMTIAGGVHATVDPVGVLSENCFDMVCVGEGEYVILDIAERIASGSGFEGIANLWVKRADGTVQRNVVRPYENNLDAFPFPDWSIYPETAFYKSFQGRVYKYGDFEMSRGCPYKCSYCINVHLQEIYKGHQFHREKSIPRVVSEIQFAIEHYQIEFLKFWDETFLLMSKERMQEFCDLYSTHIGLPYVIETTGQSIDQFSVQILAKTNCRSASLGMETGSPDMRKGLLHKPTENSTYIKAFKLMGDHGIQKVSFNMIGLPTESQEDIFRTIGLNRLVGTEVQAIGIFYPYKGTPIRNMMLREGWMTDDFDLTDLADYDFNTFTAANRSVVRFKDMDSQMINRLWLLFASYVVWPVQLFPLIDHVKNGKDDDFSRCLFTNIQRVSYFKKYGEWPFKAGGASSVDHNAHLFADKREHHGKEFSFDNPLVCDFVDLLVDNWIGDGFEQMNTMLRTIASGSLTPQFAIPITSEGLMEWLDIELDEAALKETRADLRKIAKSDSAQYSDDTLLHLNFPAGSMSEASRILQHPVQAATE